MQQTQGSKQTQGTVRRKSSTLLCNEYFLPRVSSTQSMAWNWCVQGYKRPQALRIPRSGAVPQHSIPGAPQRCLPQRGPIIKRQCGDPPSQAQATPGLPRHSLGSLHRPGSTSRLLRANTPQISTGNSWHNSKIHSQSGVSSAACLGIVQDLLRPFSP
jgi:hypothetical protein